MRAHTAQKRSLYQTLLDAIENPQAYDCNGARTIGRADEFIDDIPGDEEDRENFHNRFFECNGSLILYEDPTNYHDYVSFYVVGAVQRGLEERTKKRPKLFFPVDLRVLETRCAFRVCTRRADFGIRSLGGDWPWAVGEVLFTSGTFSTAFAKASAYLNEFTKTQYAIVIKLPGENCSGIRVYVLERALPVSPLDDAYDRYKEMALASESAARDVQSSGPSLFRADADFVSQPISSIERDYGVGVVFSGEFLAWDDFHFEIGLHGLGLAEETEEKIAVRLDHIEIADIKKAYSYNTRQRADFAAKRRGQ